MVHLTLVRDTRSKIYLVNGVAGIELIHAPRKRNVLRNEFARQNCFHIVKEDTLWASRCRLARQLEGQSLPLPRLHQGCDVGLCK